MNRRIVELTATMAFRGAGQLVDFALGFRFKSARKLCFANPRGPRPMHSRFRPTAMVPACFCSEAGYPETETRLTFIPRC